MVGGDVFEGCGGDEDLITPEDGETSFARWAVDAGLFHDCFEDCNGGACAIAESVANWEFL